MRPIRQICTFVLIVFFLKAPFLNAQEPKLTQKLTPKLTQKLTPKNLKEARSAAAWKSRRVIMNNDGNDSRRAKEKTRQAFMESRTTPLAGTHVDAIFYCDGIWGTFTHRSPTADLRAGSDKSYLEWAVDLIKDGGPDPLGSIIDFGHKNDIEVFWSLRMNDTHDSADPSMLSPWKKKHSELLVGKHKNRKKYTGGARRWSAADYAKKAVRDRAVGWFDEVAQKYDVDGFELDFFRHLIFFKNPLHGKPATQENLDQMTEVIRRIRKTADRHALRRGRPILIAIRVPDSVEYCREAGLDLQKWLDEGLIDMMTVTGYFRLSPWETSVKLGHRYNIPVYAGLSESRVKKPKRPFKNTIKEYRARALSAWKAGVDGVYTFNLFDPNSPVFREIGDPTHLAKQEKVYTTGARSVKSAKAWISGGLKYLNRPYSLPDKRRTISTDKPTTITLDVWDDFKKLDKKAPTASKETELKPTLQLLLTGLKDTSKMTVTLNDRRLKKGSLNADGLLIYPIPTNQLKVGSNRFTLQLTASQTKPIVLYDLIVSVKKTQEK